MSILKITDRAAGSINSGGTTRRAAKMVVLDIDHPDIEDFIDWKVREEQKVAALVTGSMINKVYLNSVMRAAIEGESVDFKTNKQLDSAIKKAVKFGIPMSYVYRALQLVEQGETEFDLPVYDTHYESDAYLTISGQNSNNTARETKSPIR